MQGQSRSLLQCRAVRAADVVCDVKRPLDWPPEDMHMQVREGWFASQSSQDWLYKPANSMYFHSPTETLWKRAAGQPQGGESSACAYVRMDASHLEGLTMAAFGAAGFAGRIALLRHCFAAWRRRTTDFQEMEADLRDGCEEARMSLKPRTSAPCMGKRWSDSKENVPPKHTGVLAWFGSGQGTNENQKAEALTRSPRSTLTPGALVMHARRLHTNFTSGKSDAALAASKFAAGEALRDPEAIALVHRERATQWRHCLADGHTTDEFIGVPEGALVLFDGGRRTGVVEQARPKQDKYILHEDGKLVKTEAGRSRNFKFDDLGLASIIELLPEDWLAVES